ncbi:MAG: hypothetical protein PHI23_03255 [Candidatus Peribacteraceae bacterium]|nr:hypothetical protein [Candidatus Peribacteraceae bacterium]
MEASHELPAALEGITLPQVAAALVIAGISYVAIRNLWRSFTGKN